VLNVDNWNLEIKALFSLFNLFVFQNLLSVIHKIPQPPFVHAEFRPFVHAEFRQGGDIWIKLLAEMCNRVFGEKPFRIVLGVIHQ
jgi:hypothetical protein